MSFIITLVLAWGLRTAMQDGPPPGPPGAPQGHGFQSADGPHGKRGPGRDAQKRRSPQAGQGEKKPEPPPGGIGAGGPGKLPGAPGQFGGAPAGGMMPKQPPALPGRPGAPAFAGGGRGMGQQGGAGFGGANPGNTGGPQPGAMQRGPAFHGGGFGGNFGGHVGGMPGGMGATQPGFGGGAFGGNFGGQAGQAAPQHGFGANFGPGNTNPGHGAAMGQGRGSFSGGFDGQGFAQGNNFPRPPRMRARQTWQGNEGQQGGGFGGNAFAVNAQANARDNWNWQEIARQHGWTPPRQRNRGPGEGEGMNQNPPRHRERGPDFRGPGGGRRGGFNPGNAQGFGGGSFGQQPFQNHNPGPAPRGGFGGNFNSVPFQQNWQGQVGRGFGNAFEGRPHHPPMGGGFGGGQDFGPAGGPAQGRGFGRNAEQPQFGRPQQRQPWQGFGSFPAMPYQPQGSGFNPSQHGFGFGFAGGQQGGGSGENRSFDRGGAQGMPGEALPPQPPRDNRRPDAGRGGSQDGGKSRTPSANQKRSRQDILSDW